MQWIVQSFSSLAPSSLFLFLVSWCSILTLLSAFKLSTFILSHIISEISLPKTWLCLDHCPVQSSMHIAHRNPRPVMTWLQPTAPATTPSFGFSKLFTLVTNRKSQLFSNNIVRVSMPSIGYFPSITFLYSNLTNPSRPNLNTTFFVILIFLIL